MTATAKRASAWLLGTALLAGCLTLATVGRRQAQGLRAGWPPEADLMYLPPASTLRWLALGHTELAADLVAARTNVYYGTQIASKAPQRWLDSTCTPPSISIPGSTACTSAARRWCCITAARSPPRP
jgi:hypothetical protein